MSHVDQRARGIIIHVAIDDGLYQIAMTEVEAMKGFVENEEIGRFDEGSRQQYQALFATRHLEELTISQMLDAKGFHPFQATLFLHLRRTGVETNGIFQSTGHNLDGRDVLLVASMHLGRYVADMFLDITDALA